MILISSISSFYIVIKKVKSSQKINLTNLEEKKLDDSVPENLIEIEKSFEFYTKLEKKQSSLELDKKTPIKETYAIVVGEKVSEQQSNSLKALLILNGFDPKIKNESNTKLFDVFIGPFDKPPKQQEAKLKELFDNVKVLKNF